MDTQTGKIYEFKTEEALAVAKEKAALVEINQQLKEQLEQFHEHERPSIYRDLKSKNHGAKRRARKKIAKASQRRNRR